MTQQTSNDQARGHAHQRSLEEQRGPRESKVKEGIEGQRIQQQGYEGSDPKKAPPTPKPDSA
jgi:hypothetical protein